MKARLLILLLLISILPAFSQDRLMPVNHNDEFEIHAKYCQKVNRLLIGAKEYTYSFLILPAFSPEEGLLYSPAKKELILRVARKNIWYSRGGIGVKEYRCPITSELSDKLDSLFASAVYSSLEAYCNGLDGVTYEIRTNWGKDIAECWSPESDGSNCDRLVRILESLCGFGRKKDVDKIEGLTPEIESLTKNFNSLKGKPAN